MILDIIVCILLVIAVFTGLRTIQIHQAYFREFRVPDLLAGRLDGWLYLMNSFSTAWCIVDLVLRIGWAVDMGWTDTVGLKWSLLWLGQHAGFAINAIIIHLVTDSLLDRTEVCKLCGQVWKRDAE